MSDKDFLEIFYKNNPDYSDRLQFNGTETMRLLGHTNTKQLEPYVKHGLIRVEVVGNGKERPQKMYAAKDVFECWMKKQKGEFPKWKQIEKALTATA